MANETGGRPRVLVIDDNVVTCRLLQLHLTALGYEPVLADNGEAGLAIARADCPEALLLDIQLPGIDGLEVCRRVRADRRTARIPVLLVTAMNDAATRVAGYEAGADDYVTKPFEAKELGARLHAHIALAEQRHRMAAMDGVFRTVRMLAHEFFNPLQMALGGLEMARDGEASPETIAEGLRMACDGVGQLTDLAQRLHSLAEPVYKASPIGEMLDVEASTTPREG